MDYKQDFKNGLVERWIYSDMPMIAFLTSNPDNDIPFVTFQNWVKSYIKTSAEKVAELRQANNDLQKIIDAMYETLAENLIYSVQDLKNHFACVSAADDVKEVERLKAENYRLASEVEILKGEKASVLASLHQRFIEKADLLNTIKTMESDYQNLKESVVNAESGIPQLPIINVCVEKIHDTTENKTLQEKITILENALRIIDRLTEKAV